MKIFVIGRVRFRVFKKDFGTKEIVRERIDDDVRAAIRAGVEAVAKNTIERYAPALPVLAHDVLAAELARDAEDAVVDEIVRRFNGRVLFDKQGVLAKIEAHL